MVGAGKGWSCPSPVRFCCSNADQFSVSILASQRTRGKSLFWLWTTGHQIGFRCHWGPRRKPGWGEQLLLAVLTSTVGSVFTTPTNSLHRKYPVVMGLHNRKKSMKKWVLKSKNVEFVVCCFG